MKGSVWGVVLVIGVGLVAYVVATPGSQFVIAFVGGLLLGAFAGEATK